MESNPAPETHDAPVAPVRTRFIAVAALVAVALLAGAFALGFAPRRARLEKLARESAERDDRPRVEVEKPKKNPAPPELRLPGDVRAMQQTVLGARAVGYLKKLHADVGDHVEAGQLIGWVGTTGFSTGPHLHFEVNITGQHYDPMSFMLKNGVDITSRQEIANGGTVITNP